MATNYNIFSGDTFFTLSGGDLSAAEWQAAVEIGRGASGNRRKQPLGYAVWEAVFSAESTARAVARDRGTPIQGYVTAVIEDDGRIAAAIAALRAAVAARAAKLVSASPRYICAGSRDGCRQTVSVPGALCSQCAHDRD